MSQIKLWLTIAGMVLAAVLGLKIAGERRLAKERHRAEQAERQALEVGNQTAAARAQARLAEIDRDLAKERSRPLADRVTDAVRESKRRQAAVAADGSGR